MLSYTPNNFRRGGGMRKKGSVCIPWTLSKLFLLKNFSKREVSFMLRPNYELNILNGHAAICQQFNVTFNNWNSIAK